MEDWPPIFRIIRLVLVVFLFAVLSQGSSASGPDSGPQPPCGNEIFPGYPSLGSPPVTAFWNRSDSAIDWSPPACTGWSTPGFATLTVTAGRFRDPSGIDGLRRRIGAISELKGVQYWSTTRKRWETLIVAASATSGPGDHLRPDFPADNIERGKDLYFQQTDNITGKASYRLRILSASPDRFVFAIENLSTIRYLLVPLFHAGDLQSIYFLDRESLDIWRYYSLTRTGRNSSGLTAGQPASAINRAVAFYRYWAGIPTNTEPPAVR